MLMVTWRDGHGGLRRTYAGNMASALRSAYDVLGWGTRAVSTPVEIRGPKGNLLVKVSRPLVTDPTQEEGV
jgi:hypothetical protein